MGEMTNKDVLNDMLRKTFPNVIFIRSINEGNKTRAIHFSEEWLNEEYKEPKTGHWIRQDNTKEPLYGWYFCSECNSVIGDKPKFCSNCGAKMESEG